jgi:uncharacterized membrane protein
MQNNKDNVKQPIIKKSKLTKGQKAADFVAKWAGSWTFIILFLFFLVVWAILNTLAIYFGVWDPYPFILLNLILSCIAAIQAPIILMSQNRQAEVDRQRAQYDYLVDRKAEREIKEMQIDILEIKELLEKNIAKNDVKNIRSEIKQLENELKKLNNN